MTFAEFTELCENIYFRPKKSGFKTISPVTRYKPVADPAAWFGGGRRNIKSMRPPSFYDLFLDPLLQAAEKVFKLTA